MPLERFGTPATAGTRDPSKPRRYRNPMRPAKVTDATLKEAVERALDNKPTLITLAQAMIMAPHEIKLELAPATKRWCQQIRDGVERNDREAMRTFGKVMGYVAPDQIVAVFGQMLGTDLDTAMRAVALHKQVDGVDGDETAMMAEEYLRDYYGRKGKRLVVLDDVRDATAAELEATPDAPDTSH